MNYIQGLKISSKNQVIRAVRRRVKRKNSQNKILETLNKSMKMMIELNIMIMV